MSSDPLKLLIFGAHPDDAEWHAAGLATRYRKRGHQVRLISVTNGEAGHHATWGAELVARRRAEAAAAAEVIGAEHEVWNHTDGQLQPTLDIRCQIIRELRTYAPDLVLTHRPVDYHPDHRAVGQLVQDASYLVTVPSIEADVPHLSHPPVVAYMIDRFTRPYPFAADCVIDVEPELEQIITMLACHESQMYEWLPFNRGILDQVPADEGARRDWLVSWYAAQLERTASDYRRQLVEAYGPARGNKVRYAEAYELSEYAASLDEARCEELFPREP